MADVTYLRLHDLDDDSHLPRRNLTLDSITYWSRNDFDFDFDFDFYASDPESPPAVHSRHANVEDDLSEQFESTICIRGEDDFSDPGSVPNTDLMDRENQVNFVIDLLQQPGERSLVLGHSDSLSEALNYSDFGVLDGHSDDCVDGLGLDLELGLGFGFDRDSLHGYNCGFIVENCGDDDSFFVGRRVSGYESGEATSAASEMQPFENSIRLVGSGSDSGEEENEALGICLHSDDEYNLHDVNDDVAGTPLCWDSLHLEDNRENNEDFEWEEVDGRIDEREVLSMITAEDDRSVSVSISPTIGLEEEVNVVQVRGGMENLEWEVLLNTNNLDANPDLDQDDYINTAEYEMMIGQFAENENPLTGRPPASIAAVQNLPSVMVTKDDMENNNALCAICKDEFTVGRQAKQLPCSHRYHGDCITPWLAIRNTCPVCRYEFPTDDADYEHRRASSRRL